MSDFMHISGKAGMQWSHIHYGREYFSPPIASNANYKSLDYVILIPGIFEEFKKPPKNEDAQRGLGGVNKPGKRRR